MAPDDADAPGAPLVAWLREQALPRWAGAGTDRVAGGFVEQFDLGSGAPIEAPRRTRVVARQVYVFATAARRGWWPGADALVAHGLDFLERRLRQADGTFAASCRPDGRIVDARFDLYEHVFVLFAWAAAAPRLDAARGQRLADAAVELLQTLRRRWGHPLGGFDESVPRTLPLRSNPHMHLLEAALAWCEVAEGTPQHATWVALADELAALCLARFVDDRGALRENFDGNWIPLADASGRRVEPGHQFEWAWLLLRWAGGPDAARARAVARRLLEVGEGHGVDAARGVAVNALDDAGRVTDAEAKLWPQTERIKAWSRMAAEATAGGDAAGAARAQGHLGAAVAGLSRYLAGAPAGLWHEVLGADGRFVPQPCRASSLYHIVGAIDVLQADAAEAGAGSARRMRR